MELEILETKIKAGLSSKEFRNRKLLFLSHLFSLFISNDINNQQPIRQRNLHENQCLELRY